MALNSEIRRAIAWGRPDKESTGMTADELIDLLRRALQRIEYLEAARKPPKRVQKAWDTHPTRSQSCKSCR
jgi:hypothetical protein